MKREIIKNYERVCKLVANNPPCEGRGDLVGRAATLLQDSDTLFVAHYFTDSLLHEVAEKSGGIVADSLEIASFCRSHPAKTVILAGVYFMAETIKILCPEKKIFVLTKEAQCSLDMGCAVNEFKAFKKKHSGRTIVAYINTSAAIKAEADWVVTSRIALPVVQHLVGMDEKILWAPDKHMGQYIRSKTEADISIWDGVCIVHDSFKVDGLIKLKKVYPDAAVLAHPESPLAILEMADYVGSTKGIINAALKFDNKQFIVATDDGILCKLMQSAPSKEFIQAPNGGIGATCRSCAHCPWMELNQISLLIDLLQKQVGDEVTLPADIIEASSVPLNKMLDFTEKWRL